MEESNGAIIDDALTKINVKIENETLWLSQQQMTELYGTANHNLKQTAKENITFRIMATIQECIRI